MRSLKRQSIEKQFETKDNLIITRQDSINEQENSLSYTIEIIDNAANNWQLQVQAKDH